MSHRDRDSHSPPRASLQDLTRAVAWLLDGVAWNVVRFRADCGWDACGLVAAALLWAWSGRATLLERFEQALATAHALPGRRVPETVSYQAFVKLLARWTTRLRGELVRALRDRMEREFPAHFRRDGFLVLAADGSKIGLPRTRSHEDRFAPAKSRRRGKKRGKKRGAKRPRGRRAQAQHARQRKADGPQLALTALYHVGLRLPWDWRLGASDAAERDHVLDMLADLPADALLVADAGFVGYDFWSALLASRRRFVIRVGGNVRLLKNLGYARESGGTVYLWPDRAAKRGQPPLVLRLVKLQGGRQPWHLVTNVAPARLSDAQAADLYRRRWGVELFFRHCKQTYGRGKLRSHKAENAESEMQWSLLGLWTMMLYALARLPTDEPTLPRLSVARTLRAYRDAFHPTPRRGPTLAARLQQALLDPYRRTDKRSRAFPRKKYDPPAKAPRLTRATAAQRLLAQQIPPPPPSPKGLTA